MMVGEKVELNIERPEPVNPVKRLDIEHLTVRSAEGITVLDDASFPVYGGEILGIAGISGNGQKELLEAIAGFAARRKRRKHRVLRARRCRTRAARRQKPQGHP